MNDKAVKDRALNSVMHLFAGGMTPDEEQRLNEQRRNNPQFEEDFSALTHALAAVEQLRDDADFRAEIDAAKTKPAVAADARQPGKAPGYRWLGWATAALLVVSLSVVFTVFQQPQQSQDARVLRYITQVGEQKTVELADGSKVTMNTGSRLLVDMSDALRRVILERGEAYFDVATDPQRPFKVDVGGRAVTVLGTEFNIQRSADSFTLAVIEGVVGLHKSSESVLPSAVNLAAKNEQGVQASGEQQYRVNAGWVVNYQLADNQFSAVVSDNPGSYQQWRRRHVTF